MLEYIKLFYTTYISHVPSNKRKPPQPNFFHTNNKKYLEFLNYTKEINKNTILIKELNNNEIQRNPYNTEFFI